MICDLTDEIPHLRSDDTIKPIRAFKNQLMGLDPQVCIKYAKLAKMASIHFCHFQLPIEVLSR